MILRGKVSEIFKSRQGEGFYQGYGQVFVRFFGCNLTCSFCDTRLDSYKERTIAEVLGEISRYSGYHSVSLTGGEPLLQAEFLRDLAGELKRRGKKVYLETNGTLDKNLKKTSAYIDIIAMDLKLPSSTNGGPFWDAHRRFLGYAAEKEVFAKAVICRETDFNDLAQAVQLLKDFNENTPLVLQPDFFSENKDLNRKINHFFSYAKAHLASVSVRGQLHKAMNWR